MSNCTLRILSLISNNEHRDESTNVAQDKYEQDNFDVSELPTASVHSIENSAVNDELSVVIAPSQCNVVSNLRELESIQNEAEQYRLEQDKLETVNTFELDELVSSAIPETYASDVPCKQSVPDNFTYIEVPVSSAISVTYVGDVPDIEYVQNVHPGPAKENNCSQSSSEIQTLQMKNVNCNDLTSASSSEHDSLPESISSDESPSSERSEPFGSDDSYVDPTYDPDLQADVTADETNERVDIAIKKRKVKRPSGNEKVGRKRIKRPATWAKNEAKKLRNSGESYISMGIVKNQDGTKAKTMVVRPPRSILPPCGDKCKLKCSEKIKEEERTKVFREYWDLKDIEKQREFISSNMKTVNPKYKYSNVEKPRKPNNAFYFIIEGKETRVCKFYFMATLAINHKVITTVLRKQSQCESGKVVEKDKRGLHGNHQKVNEDVKNSFRNHINTIPRIESHYCRSQSSKEYIEGNKTIADLHRDYTESCKEKNLPAANYLMYSKIFNEEFNLAFHLPKKDQCELCLQYRDSPDQEKLNIEEKYNKHVKEKELSRKEKENDKNSEDKTKVIVYDLQAVLPCPTGEASSFYYVSKLNVFNFTLYDIKSHEGTCFLWHEGEAQRGANEIGSCIFNFLQSLQDREDVVFYSDNCAGQNKNKFIIALYMHALFLLGIKSITHKFFVVGHGQSEGDSVHSMIEKQVKKFKIASPIFSPDQYACIIRSAKKTGAPYKVKEMSFNDFFDLKALATDLFINIPKNIKMSDIRVLMVDKDHPNILFYKTSFGDNEFSRAEIINSRRKVDMGKIVLKKAYPKKVGITEAKKKGLLSLIQKKNAFRCSI